MSFPTGSSSDHFVLSLVLDCFLLWGSFVSLR